MIKLSSLIFFSFMLFSKIGFSQSKIPTVPKYEYVNEVKVLSKKACIAKAFSIIDQLEPVTLKDHIRLTEIPAPPFKEKIRGLYYKKMLEKAGASNVWIDSVGNVIALRKGTIGAKNIVLDAHLDTVFPEGTDLKVKIKGDTLFAPGILDDTRGLMIVLTVLRALEKAKIETKENILFIGSVGEEGLGDLRGVKYLFREDALKIDSWISLDGVGGNLGCIANKGIGSIRYRVTFKGVGGHSWKSFGLGNPHHVLGKAINYFEELATSYINSTEEIKTSFNVGRIGGGTSVNSIPFESWMEVDMRSETPNNLEKIENILISSIDKTLIDYNNKIRHGPLLSVEIEGIGFRPSGKTDETLPLVQQATATASYFGLDTFLCAGSYNANIPMSKGIPAINLNLGGQGGEAHSLNEWWINDQGVDAIKMALLVLMSQVGISE